MINLESQQVLKSKVVIAVTSSTRRTVLNRASGSFLEKSKSLLLAMNIGHELEVQWSDAVFACLSRLTNCSFA